MTTLAAVPATGAAIDPRRATPTVPRRPWWRSLWFHSALFFALFYVLAPYDIAKSTDIRGTSRAEINEQVDKFGEGNPVRNAVILALGAFAVVSLLQRSSNRVRVRGFVGITILVFLAWVLASPLWGDDLATTARKVVGFVLLCLAALAMARQVERTQLLQFVALSLASFAVGGIVAEIAIGSYTP